MTDWPTFMHGVLPKKGSEYLFSINLTVYHIAGMFGGRKVWRVVHDLPNLNQPNFSR